MALLTRAAIAVAFPAGVPGSDDEKDGLTDWSGDQADRLALLAGEFEAWNGRIINVLAEFHRASDAREIA